MSPVEFKKKSNLGVNGPSISRKQGCTLEALVGGSLC